MSDINIKTNTSKVKNEKTAKQDKDLANLKNQKLAAEEKAKQARIDAEEKRKLAAEKKKQESEIDSKEVLDLASKVIKSSSKSGSGFIKGAIVGVIVGFILSTLLGFSGLITNEVNEGKESVDEVIDETFFGYTALDFENVILGEATQHQELIVMEQPILVETKITKSGLGNLEIFSKVKNVTYAGTGVYTVDLSQIDKDHIKVDLDNKTVKITIPHTVLQYVNPDLDSAKFEDTEKGLLAFGDLALTPEDQNTLEKTVRDAMIKELDTKELKAQADGFAEYMTWQIFQPLIASVSNEFVVEVVIGK